MKNIENSEPKTGFSKIFAPFTVCKAEIAHLLWILVVLVFGLFNFLVALTQGHFDMINSAFADGTLYVFSISICAPFIFELLEPILVDKKNQKLSHFVTFIVISVIVDVVWVFILACIWGGVYRGDFWCQLIFGVLSIVYAFYMYCITKMEKYLPYTKEYDDAPYLEQEKNAMHELEQNAENTTSISEDGKEVIV